MKVVQTGYFSKGRKLETSAVRWAEKLIPKLLSAKSQKRFKILKFVFSKNPIESWQYGYHWLVNGSTIEIVICGGYRQLETAKWLIAHELAHVEQIASGQLNKSLANTRFNGHEYKWDEKRLGFQKITGKPLFFGRSLKTVPWERQANIKAYNAIRWVR